MHKPLALLYLTAIATLQTAAATELTGTPLELEQYLQSKTRVVTLGDTATETAYTDVAKINLIVTTEDKSLAGSLHANLATRERIRLLLAEAGIDPENVSSAKYSASPQYGWFGKKPASFEVVNSLEVEVNNENLFQRVAEVADREDAVSFGGVDFEHSEEDEYKNKVRDEAVEKILEDAAYFEQKLGVTLVPVSFQLSDVGISSHNRMNMINEIVVTGSRLGSGAAPSAPPPPPSFDEVNYRVAVDITFEITPTKPQ
ncbi:MAG: SIMPL domain-containing protein [Pseudomonadota bacterium]